MPTWLDALLICLAVWVPAAVLGVWLGRRLVARLRKLDDQ